MSSDWRDKLYLKGLGSFRGKKFYVSSSTSDIGRRTVVHEFPGKDKATVEDLGKAVPRYRLEAYVLGPGYMDDRDALAKEFQTPGPGELVHPFWGKFTVAVDGRVQLTETFDSGGMARFSLSVVEVPPSLGAAVSAVNTLSQVTSAAVGALTAIQQAFAAAYAIAGYISDVADQASAIVNGATSTLNGIKGKINAVLNKIDAIGDSIDAFGESVASIIAFPGSLASSFMGIIDDVFSSISTIGTAWDSYFGDDESSNSTAGAPSKSPTAATPASGDVRAELLLSSAKVLVDSMSALVPVAETTPSRVHQNANQSALSLLVKASSTISVCKVSAEIAYVSSGAAIAMRDNIVDQIDELVELMDDDASYAAFVALRSAVVTHLTKTAADLPRVVSHTPNVTLPALVLAQHLYGSIDRAQDLIDRNHVRNPAKVSGGLTLEVLSAQ